MHVDMYYPQFADGDIEKIQEFLKNSVLNRSCGVLWGILFDLVTNGHLPAIKFLMDEYDLSFPCVYSRRIQEFSVTLQLLYLYEFPEEHLTDFLIHMRDILVERCYREQIEIIKMLVIKGADTSYLADDKIPELRKLHLLANPRRVWCCPPPRAMSMTT